MAEIANPATVARASMRDSTLRRSQAKASPGALAPLASVAVEGWRALADRAIEPNGYYLPGWALAIDASARGRTDVAALGAWSDAAPNAARLIGLMPAVSLWRAY
ncbi:MAG TPA: GNAT family N-acetyltransferase, partial [Bradyrhizobium sp.]|nr:GNAT family N-acetyltransferase [Bradyrhizobium sp.]